MNEKTSKYLTLTTLWANSADDKMMFFFSYFSMKTGFDISCKLSPLVFRGKIGKNISLSSAEFFTQNAKHL